MGRAGVIRLARVTLREIRLPLREPFETSAGVVEQRRILLLQLADIDGAETWSECVAESLPAYSPDTVDTCWLALSEWIVPLILRHSLATPRDAHAILESKIRGHRMARAAVEMGIWALTSAKNKVSLASLLVTESKFASDRGTSPRAFVETGIALGMQTGPETLAERSLAARAEGYRRIKMKISPGKDVQFVRAARGAVGDNVSLTVDANGSYSLDNRKHVD